MTKDGQNKSCSQRRYAKALANVAIARREWARYGIFLVQPIPYHIPGFDVSLFVKDVRNHLPGSIQMSLYCLSGKGVSEVAFSNHWLPR